MKPVNNASAEPTLLFIPDISGFTKFVNETEISHSQHIITELLETLIDANEMGLQISEIEGDAILFYRKGKKPTAVETLAQVQRMYIKFHACLRRYESQRICQCGACLKASNLNIKFIIHYGEISINQIKTIPKLFGKDVIVAHRLLKNNISMNEYVLITDQLIQSCSTWVDIGQVAWETPSHGKGTYDFGDIKYCFLSLAPLESHIPKPTIDDYAPEPNMKQILSVGSVINAPLELVFNVVSDPEAKHLWVQQVKGSDKTNGKIVKNGTTHRCIMNGDEKDPFFTSHSFKITKDFITWIDTNHTFNADMVVSLKRLGKDETKTHITVLKKLNPIKKLLYNLFMKKSFTQFYIASLNKLNTYCIDLKKRGEKHPAGILLEPRSKAVA
ncbi:DUF2652 domain-containing protein [Flavobacteriaceae bacterium GSB9]|nr:DUF2652 domain-containing protein [Flavobacteriaceae bacterium GSB9]